MCHGAAAAFLQRQARLCPVERLDLAFLIDGQHHGVRRRAYVESHDVTQLGGKLRVVGQLEVARPVRLQTMPAPDPLHRADADTLHLGHGRCCPVRRLARRRVAKGCLHNPGLHICAEWRNTRRTGLVLQQARDALGHKPFLPAPDSRLARAAAPHDLRRAATLCRKQDDLGAPDMLLRTVPIRHNRFELRAVFGTYLDCDTVQHAADSHGHAAVGTAICTQVLDFIH